jgi:Arc/MetJ-type ribon-helix-helix transcriptional regulator
MTITLPKDLEELVQREVADGHFPSVNELVANAVRSQLEGLAALRASLEDAEAEADRDGWLTMDELKSRLAQRRKK